MPRSEPGRQRAIGIALVSLIPLSLALGQPFSHDDLNSLTQAALCRIDASHLADPWMGGLWRFVPKLMLFGLFLVAGPASWMYRLVNLLGNALIVYMIARVVGSRAQSSTTGSWAAALFAAGFGFYAAAVIQVSNLTMIVALALVLAAWRLAQCGRRTPALVAMALAALSHEAAWAAILFAPFALGRDDVEAPRYALAACLVVLGVACFIPGRASTYALTEAQYWIFAIVPLNASLSATTSLPHAVEGLSRAYVALRPWAGGAALLLLLFITLRARGAWIAAVAWLVIFTLPFAAAIAFWPEVWPEHWLSRRYLYAPAVGLCFLAALCLMRLAPGLRRWAGAALIAWGLGWSGLTIWGAAREAASPSQSETRAQWVREMEALDSRWSTPRR